MRKSLLIVLVVAIVVVGGILLLGNRNSTDSSVAISELAKVVYPYEKDLGKDPASLVSDLKIYKMISLGSSGSLICVSSQALSGSNNVSGMIVEKTADGKLRAIAPFSVSVADQNNKYFVSPDSAYVAIRTAVVVSSSCGYNSLSLSRITEAKDPSRNSTEIGEPGFLKLADPSKNIVVSTKDVSWTGGILNFKQAFVKCTTGNNLIGPLEWQYDPTTNKYSRKQ